VLNAGSSQPQGGKPKKVLVGVLWYTGWEANAEH